MRQIFIPNEANFLVNAILKSVKDRDESYEMQTQYLSYSVSLPYFHVKIK